MLKVLCTGGGGAGSEALARLWEGCYEVHFCDADVDAIPASVSDSHRHLIPMAGPDWVSAVTDLCRRIGIDMLIPGVDEELSLAPQVTDALPSLKALSPDSNYVALMKDKLLSMNALVQRGLDAPRTVTIDRVAEIGFPCLVKPRAGRGSRGVQVLSGLEDVGAYRQLSRQPDSALVAQQLLSGQEWTVYLAADIERRLRSVVPMRVDVKRGITLRAETVANPAVIDYCQAVHEKFPTAGPYNIQLIVEPGGRIAAFEINPRVSTTLCLAVAAGADPVASMLAGTPPDGLLPFQTGLRLRRNWHNHIDSWPRK
jgi:carbamoyl-phosphate synthase large subunit